MENKRILLVEASEGEIKKLNENSAQRNKKKSAKYTGLIIIIIIKIIIIIIIKGSHLKYP